MESDTLSKSLRNLGFYTLDEYFQSPQFEVIKKHILQRDAFRCRAKKCNQKAKDVLFLAYTLKSLSGQHPSLILSTCDSCRTKILEESENDPTHLSKTILPLLLNLHYVPGKSNPAIGRWYKNQYNMNQTTVQHIQASLRQLVSL